MNSFFGLPPPMEEDHFSNAFHQTPCVTCFTPQQNPTLIFNPINLFDSNPSNFAKKFENSCAIDLMSCTENLGFESSDEMVTSFDDLGHLKKTNSCEKNQESLPLSSSPSLNCGFLRREKMVSKSEFPPPLTTLDEKWRTNFMMKSVRENGRLKIVGVMIERPEILRATRGNGRLRLNLIQRDLSSSDDDDDGDGDDVDGDVDVDVHVHVDEGVVDDEKEVIIPASGCLRRCHHHHHHQQQHVWGPHQNRCVTTV